MAFDPNNIQPPRSLSECIELLKWSVEHHPHPNAHHVQALISGAEKALKEENEPLCHVYITFANAVHDTHPLTICALSSMMEKFASLQYEMNNMAIQLKAVQRKAHLN